MKFCFFVLLVSALFSCHQVDNDNAAPDCQKKMSETRIHNRVLVDHYAWLKNREDSTVRDYLKAENAYVSRSMISTKSLQENLYQELLGRINETDNSVPYKKGKYLYYSKTYEGKDHPAYYRKMPGSDREELLIDANDYLKKTGYYDAWFYDFSDTEKYMSIGVDKSGNFEETIYFFESSNKNMPIDS
ncbi:MAG: hypothetical protein MRY83_02255, partial [Flavobacteriales bacterium]|nr:hypothetical protein [Flavobacteriales bacterium]